MSGGGHAGAEITPGVEQVLVDRVAVCAELDRQYVDRRLVERDRNEHLTLALGQLADRVRQGLEALLLFEPVSGSRRQRVGQLLDGRLFTAGGCRRQACRATLPETSNMTNL